MVFAPDDMVDTEVDVVDHRGQGVQVGSVLALEARVRKTKRNRSDWPPRTGSARR